MTNKILENMARAIAMSQSGMHKDILEGVWRNYIKDAQAALDSLPIIILPHNAEVLIDDVIWREKDGYYDVIRVTELKLKPERSGHNLHSIIQRNGKQVIHVQVNFGLAYKNDVRMT